MLSRGIALIRRKRRERRRLERVREQRRRDGIEGPLPTPRKWVFIVGCYNSGTTLLHDLLASHPEVGSLPQEGQFLTDQLPVPRDLGLPRLWALDPARFYLDETMGQSIDVTALKRQWGAHYDDPQRPVLLEKSPTNAARIRWLEKHFEEASFIAIIRDGYAVTAGIRRKAGHPIEMAARQWAVSNEIMFRDLATAKRQRIVHYEDLTARPDEVMGSLLGFLDLAPHDVRWSGRTWTVHERQSEIRDMNAESVAALTVEERASVTRVAGPMLERFGYVPI